MVGWRLIRELAGLYGAYARAEQAPLPPLPFQYADFAIWQRKWLASRALEAQLDYWRAQLLHYPTQPLCRPITRGHRCSSTRAQHLSCTIQAS